MRRALFGGGQRRASSLIATTLTSADVATIAAFAAPTVSIFVAGIGAAAFAVRKFESVRGEINNLAMKINGDLGKVTAEMKGDLDKMTAEMKGDLGTMDAKFVGKLEGDLGKVTAEMKGDLGKVTAEMKGDLGKMDVKVDETVKRVEATSRAFAESESHKVAASRSALAR